MAEIVEQFKQKAIELGYSIVAIASRCAMLEIHNWTTVVPITPSHGQNYITLVKVRGKIHERATSKLRKFQLDK